jgi:hypothetical protein
MFPSGSPASSAPVSPHSLRGPEPGAEANLKAMGFLARWMLAVKKSLDGRVTGHVGEAHDRLSNLADATDLVVRARLPGGHRGALGLHVQPPAGDDVQASGSGMLECNLGPGGPLHGAKLQVEAHVENEGQPGLAVLSVELCQPNGDQAGIMESYSVESQFDTHGQAMLKMTIDLG